MRCSYQREAEKAVQHLLAIGMKRIAVVHVAFPDMKGFSLRIHMRAFADAWAEPEFVQQAAARFPWFHLCTLIDKLKTSEERDWYLPKAFEHNWSRNVLVMQIETKAYARSGQAVTNFEARLPKPQSDLARESLKDPYRFDFLSLSDEAREHDAETARTERVPSAISTHESSRTSRTPSDRTRSR